MIKILLIHLMLFLTVTANNFNLDSYTSNLEEREINIGQQKTTGSDVCQNIVNYAEKYLGTRYGGTGVCSADSAQAGKCTTQCGSFITNVYRFTLKDAVTGNGNTKCNNPSMVYKFGNDQRNELQPGDVFSAKSCTKSGRKYGHTGASRWLSSA